VKAEIGSLEYAVCALMCKLELLLTQHFGYLTLSVGGGFNISTPAHLSLGSDAFVTIVPVGWPKGSRIDARFYRSGGEWVLFEGGEILAPHNALFRARIPFKPTEDGLGLRLDPFAESDRDLARVGYEQLIASLERELALLRSL
jgi:hypothetical protein